MSLHKFPEPTRQPWPDEEYNENMTDDEVWDLAEQLDSMGHKALANDIIDRHFLKPKGVDTDLKVGALQFPLPKTTATTTETKSWSYSSCNHWREPIHVLNGTILCSGYMSRPKTVTDASLLPYPDAGYYLDWMWPRIVGNISSAGMPCPIEPLWPFVSIDWPDRGIIDDASLRLVAEQLAGYLKAGKTVEIGCQGGHGRTGTLIAAVMLLHSNQSVKECVDWLRRAYCKEAIETEVQVNQLFRIVGETNITLSGLCACGHGKRKHRWYKMEERWTAGVKRLENVLKESCKAKGCSCWKMRAQTLVQPSSNFSAPVSNYNYDWR